MGLACSTTTASSVAAKSFASWTLAPATTTESGPPPASTKMLLFTPFFALSVGLGPMRSPKMGLARRRVRRLPLPIGSAKLLAFFNQGLPDPIEDPQPDPALESTMNGGIVGKLCGQPVPLTAASQPKDDRVKGGALVHPRAPGPLRWVMLGKDRLDLLPQLIRHAPNRR